MVEFRSLFPLNLVAFPGEELNLHIFEPRYIQLIEDSLSDNKKFGIPAYVKNKIEFGTEAEITEVSKEYGDGRKDIKTKAGRIFRVLNFMNPVRGKLYSGGKVEFIRTDYSSDPSLQNEIEELLADLYQTLNIKTNFLEKTERRVFDIAHNIGLSKEQEYELLKITREDLRQTFVINHLQKAIPLLKDMERSKEKIKMNGHFKNFDPINF